MEVIEKLVKYGGLALITYLLIKAFTDGLIEEKHIYVLVGLIMVPIVLIGFGSDTCPKMKEGYQITDPPIVPSIYPGPPNQDRVLGTVAVPPPMPPMPLDKDVRDQMSITGIDMKIYDALGAEEERAKDKIRAAYTNDMVYTESNPLNTIPLGTQIYGYTYLPAENWFRAYERPPPCLVNGQEPLVVVRPISEGAYLSDLLEYDSAANALGPGLGYAKIRPNPPPSVNPEIPTSMQKAAVAAADAKASADVKSSNIIVASPQPPYETK